jgi:hypothetical protein
LWNNERVATGIRCDKKLYLAFKPVAIAKFGSTCRAIEVFMAAVVGGYKQEVISGASPTNTSIVIENMHIERNLQPRRKLKRTHAEIDTFELDYPVCGYSGCDGEAVGKAVLLGNGREFDLCADHLKRVSADRLNWRVIQ